MDNYTYLSKMVLMRGHNIYFVGIIRKIIPKLSFLPFLSKALDFTFKYQRITLGKTLARASVICRSNSLSLCVCMCWWILSK